MARLYKIDSEDQIQANFFNWLSLNARTVPQLDLFFAVPNGGYRHVTTAKRLKATGCKSGIPDTFLPIAMHGYYGLWIEFKTEKGTLSANQKIWIERLKAEFYRVEVCRSWTDAARVVIDYLGLNLKI